MRTTLAILLTAFSMVAFAATPSNNNSDEVFQFSYPTVDGKQSISPQDFKGEYLLLDFWASWCPPCLAATPKLIELYNQYNPKGFEILGVSIDSNSDAWKKMVAQKKLPWTNVLSPDRGKEVSSKYGFAAIPHFVLIDKQGNIIQEGFTIEQLPDILAKNIK